MSGTVQLIYKEQMVIHRVFRDEKKKDEIVAKWKKIYAANFSKAEVKTVYDTPINKKHNNYDSV